MECVAFCMKEGFILVTVEERVIIVLQSKYKVDILVTVFLFFFIKIHDTDIKMHLSLILQYKLNCR